MTRLRSDHGTTLIELLIAMSLMVMMLGATLIVWDALQDDGDRNQRMSDAQQEVRQTLDRLSRELRNLASPSVLTDLTTIQPNAVERNEPFDLIFLKVADVKSADPGNLNDANIERVRYCLDAPPAGSGLPAGADVLYQQRQTWTTASKPLTPSATACRGAAGWPSERIVAQAIVNQSASPPVPFFRYDNTDLTRITRIRTEALVDPDPQRTPPRTSLITSVILRNQNRVPTADFDVANGSLPNTLILNGSKSTDPEKQSMRFSWKIDGSARSECAVNAVTCITNALTSGSHTIELTVSDPADLPGVKTKSTLVPVPPPL
jgi:type II secretory pathway pseudopilin PulG